MKTLASRLLEAFQGGLLALVLLRVMMALSASPSPDFASLRTVSAGFLPQLFHVDFFVTPKQATLLMVMSTIVALVGCAWGVVATTQPPQRRSRS